MTDNQFRLAAESSAEAKDAGRRTMARVALTNVENYFDIS